MLRRAVSQSLRLSRHQASRPVSTTSVLFNGEKPADAEPATAATPEGEPAAADASAAPVDPLVKEVEELKAKNQELNDRLLRALADAENVRRISRVDVNNAREFAISKFAKSLLDVSDNLKRAHESISIEELHPDHTLPAIKTLHEGVVMTDAQLQKVFREFNINQVGAVGDKFDPNVHDALFEYEDATKEAGSIGQLMKIGYLLNSRCIRPAQVGVVKATKQ
uniref:GrpE protein homolog n=1 Tax=Globisporangium ultimum (strain ATCC 200006 / CBS 805.95 / DAOM BR144) TaxID=431595 RepID=K3WEF9_GLOUD